MFPPVTAQMEAESGSDWDSLPGDVHEPSSSAEVSPRHQPVPPTGSPRGQIRPQVKQQKAALSPSEKASKTNSSANQFRSKQETTSSQMPSQLYGKGGITNFVDRSGGINTTAFTVHGSDSLKSKELQPPSDVKEKINKVHGGAQEREAVGIDIELNEANHHQRNPPYTDFQAALSQQDSQGQSRQSDKPSKSKVKASYVKHLKSKEEQGRNHSWDSESEGDESEHISQSRQHLTPREKKSKKVSVHLDKNNMAKQALSEDAGGQLELRTFGSPHDVESQVTGYCYHFDHGHNYELNVKPEWKEPRMKKLADRSEKWLHYFWQEVFSALRIVTDFVFIFLLELLRFVLHYIAFRLLGGLIITIGDHFLKPLSALFFNSIVQPSFIFTRNVLMGLNNLLQPFMDIFNNFIAQLGSLLRAFRLFELNWKPVYEGQQKHNVHVL